MVKKALMFAVVTVFVLMSALPAAAEDGYVLQTGELTISAWHLHYSRHTFSVSNPGFATLAVTKTTPEIDISRGFLFMNRRAIPLKHFFRGNDLVFEKKIKLKAFNRLNVFLLGTPGATIKIDIRLQETPEPPPTATFEAAPMTITLGEASNLAWQAENAETVTIDNGIGDVELNGTIEVIPVETTTYTLTATGPGGTATAQVTVTVNYLPPTVQIAAIPDTIVTGQSTELTWSSEWADSCVIEPDIGVVDLTGSMTVTPAQTTTYRIIATGDGGETAAETTVTVTDPPPTVEISAAQPTITLGETTTLTWTSTHADACTIEPGLGTVDPNGSINVPPTETTTYTISASGSGGGATAQVTVAVEYPVPVVSFSASPSAIQIGFDATLSWTTTYADTVQIDPGIGDVATTGTQEVSPIETTTYTLTAAGPGGTTTQSVTITVTHPAPTVTFAADPVTITSGQSATLIWNSSYTSSANIDPGIGSVPTDGSMSVTPTQTTTYTLTVTGAGGTTTANATVTVNIPEPVATFNANPQAIMAGNSATLTWTSTYADSVTIEPGIGSVNLNGSAIVSPSQSTTYTLTATGVSGTTTETVTVTVHPPPMVTLTADPETIAAGDETTLSWTSTGADSVTIEPDPGSVALNGSTTISPSQSTTYTITATGPGGIATATVSVTVIEPPGKPVITGSTIHSGIIQTRPVQNISRQFIVELTGTREAGTSVWINGDEQVANGDTSWSTQVNLQPGNNTFEIWLVDLAGNRGLSEWVDIQMQTNKGSILEYDASGRTKTIIQN